MLRSANQKVWNDAASQSDFRSSLVSISTRDKQVKVLGNNILNKLRLVQGWRGEEGENKWRGEGGVMWLRTVWNQWAGKYSRVQFHRHEQKRFPEPSHNIYIVGGFSGRSCIVPSQQVCQADATSEQKNSENIDRTPINKLPGLRPNRLLPLFAFEQVNAPTTK